MSNSFEEAAQILRELKERVARNEQERTRSTAINVFRGTNDKSLGSDNITTSTGSAGGWTWGSSDWDHEEWGE